MFIVTVLVAALGLATAPVDSVAAEATLAGPDSVGSRAMRVDSVPIRGSLVGEDSSAAVFIDSLASDLGSGEASYYGQELAGRPTASGELFDPEGLTAAHPTLPLGSMVRVTNLDNGRSVIVRINDRGPFTGGRIIDVSRGAAGVLGMIRAGTAFVRLHLVPR